jgi:hypothetical protein
MRMRLGATLPPGERLERKPRGDEDAELEVLAAEIELFMRMRDQHRAHAARLGRAAAAKTAHAAKAEPAARSEAAASRMSPAKAKIVRALRKKR